MTHSTCPAHITCLRAIMFVMAELLPTYLMADLRPVFLQACITVCVLWCTRCMRTHLANLASLLQAHVCNVRAHTTYYAQRACMYKAYVCAHCFCLHATKLQLRICTYVQNVFMCSQRACMHIILERQRYWAFIAKRVLLYVRCVLFIQLLDLASTL